MATLSANRLLSSAALGAALLALSSLAALSAACEASTTAGADAATDTSSTDTSSTDTAGADTGTTAKDGTVHVTGHYTGTLAGTPNLRVSMFPCPFQMPPKYFFEGTYDAATGDVDASQANVDAGEWCLMAYIDVNPADGLAPVPGLDPQNTGNGENSSGAVPVTVAAGQTTEVTLSFALAAAANP